MKERKLFEKHAEVYCYKCAILSTSRISRASASLISSVRNVEDYHRKGCIEIFRQAHYLQCQLPINVFFYLTPRTVAVS